MSDSHAIGHQLDGQQLYEMQKQIRMRPDYLAAPTIVATSLKMSVNQGSVLRIADSAGCKQVIFLSNNADQDRQLSKLHRTARNSESLLDWRVSSYEEFLADDVPRLAPLIAIELTSNSVSLFDTQLPEDCAFVIGNERHGIPTSVLQQCRQAIHVPMYGINGSMNVTHALAVVIFEWRRQHSSQ